MSSPLFLLYGANGWIGTQIQQILTQKSIPYLISQVRADQRDLAEQEILQTKPTHLLATIGRTHGTYQNTLIPNIDYLEKPGKLADNVRDNLYAPVTLASLAQKHQIHFTYLGTGCIYTYDETHPVGNPETGFTEEDTPNFTGSSYSTVKGYTDQLMANFTTTLNARIRMPIVDGQNSRDFIAKILKYDKICDMPNSMSVLPTLLPLMVDMALRHKTGTINLVNPGLISHNQILKLYQQHVDPEFTWQNFSLEDQDKILLSKRSNNCLDTSKLVALYPNVPAIDIAVTKIITQMIQSITK